MPSGKPLSVERLREQLRIVRIGEQIVTRASTIFSPILLPPPCLENGLRPSSAERASSVEADELHEIADGLRLENDRVAARLDRDRIA